MKSIFVTKGNLLAGAMGVALAGAFCLPVSAHEFTDPYGRKMNAEILSAAGDTVTIRREDNQKEYTVKASSFSKADQEYIRQWVRDNPEAISYRLRVLASPYAGSGFGAGMNEAKKATFRYKFAIYNQSKLALPDSEVFYKVFIKEYERRPFYTTTAAKVQSSRLKSAEGSVAIKQIKAKGKVEVITKQPSEIPLYAEAGYRRKADELAGVWVKIFRGGKLIREDKFEVGMGDLNGATFLVPGYEGASTPGVIVDDGGAERGPVRPEDGRRRWFKPKGKVDDANAGFEGMRPERPERPERPKNPDDDDVIVIE